MRVVRKTEPRSYDIVEGTELQEAEALISYLVPTEPPSDHSISLLLWTKPDHRTYWLEGLKSSAIASRGLELSDRFDVFVALALQNRESALAQAQGLGKRLDLEHIRGTAATAAGMGGFMIDIDVAHPCHSERDLPRSYDEAREIIAGFPMPPTLTIDSGHGLHLFWAFKAIWLFTSEEDRQAAQTLYHGLWMWFRDASADRGWSIDPISGLNSMVRVPGTMNRKDSADPKKVNILEHHPENRYEPREFERFLPPVEQGTMATEPLGTALDETLQPCRWLQHCKDDARILPEPEWYAALSILGRLPSGDALCHEISRDFHSYSAVETEDKLGHALTAAGPRTCANIAKSLGAYDRFCSQCTHWKQISSPIQVIAQAQHANTWETPRPLPEIVQLPEFPLDALPDSLGRYVQEVSVAIDVSPDLPALLVLGIFAFAVSRFFKVHIRPGHEEALCLWLLCILPSGERKSAAFSEMTKPLVEYQGHLIEKLGPQILQQRELRAVEETRLKRLREQIAKAPSPRPEGLQAELTELAGHRTQVPELPKLWISDATPESVPCLLAAQGGRIAVLDSEGGGVFDQLCGRYSTRGIPNIDAWLKCHNEEAIRVDRVGRDPVGIDRPSITAILTAQPIVVEDISSQPQLRGRGFLARLAYSFPRTRVGMRIIDNTISPKVSDDLRTKYQEAVRNVLEVTCNPPQVSDPPKLLCLSSGALRSWSELANRIERDQADGGDLASMRDWASKFAGLVARIAGVLHVVQHAYSPISLGTSVDSVDRDLRGASSIEECWTLPVSRESMENAIQIGSYLLEHARHFFSHPQSSPSVRQAERILAWLKASRPVSFTRRDYQRSISRGGNPELISRAFELLEEHGFIRLHAMPPRGEKGRPKGRRYDVNLLYYRQVDDIDKNAGTLISGERGFPLGEPGGAGLKTRAGALGDESAQGPSSDLGPGAPPEPAPPGRMNPIRRIGPTSQIHSVEEDQGR